MVQLYLQQLLEERKKVIIPELGQFSLEETPAGFDPVTGQLHPARRTITFDESKRFEPTDFAAWVAERENDTVEAVLHAVHSLIYDLRHDITENGEYHLKGLGNFSIDDHFNLKFTQSDEPNFVNFGLPDLDVFSFAPLEELPVDISEQQATEIEETKLETVHNKGLDFDLESPDDVLQTLELENEAASEIASVVTSELAEEIEDIETENAESIPDNKALVLDDRVIEEPIEIKNAAHIDVANVADEEEDKEATLTWPVILLMVLVVVISGFGIYYYMNYINPVTEVVTAHKADSAATDSTTLAENTAPTNQVEVPIEAQSTAEEPKKVSEPKPETALPTAKKQAKTAPVEKKAEVNENQTSTPSKASTGGNFKVIAGTFGVENNAINLVASAKNKGYAATITVIDGEKPKYKVSIGSAATEAEAKALKEKAQPDFTERLVISK